MARTVAIGIQYFEQIIKNDYFYVDKTNFIDSVKIFSQIQFLPSGSR